MIEVELYRRLAERACMRTICAVDAHDAWYCKGATEPERLADELVGASFIGFRRIGKLLLGGLNTGSTLGLRFGMTGRLLVDGTAGIDELLYSSDQNLAAWDRFRVHFADGGSLAIRDPRRLGSVEFDPDISVLGPDASAITLVQLQLALHSARPLKAVLLDQNRIAGIGNLLADELLWRAKLSAIRPADSLAADEVKALRKGIRETLRVLTKRGGSHTGDLMQHRRAGGICPLDGKVLRHDTVGGRSTWWCENHQV